MGGTGGGLLGWATLIEPHWLQLAREQLPIKHLPNNLIGKKLVHASDFHIGETDEVHLAAVIDHINELQPDILALTGDFIDHQFANSNDSLKRIFGQLRPAKIATLGCLGNHDYGHRWQQREVADGVTETLRNLGVQMLQNEQIEIDGLTVYGLDDLWSPRFRPAGLFPDQDIFEPSEIAKLVRTTPSLCLCHNPDACDLDVWGSFDSVILSGHTHGGQCKPPFLPPPKLPVQNRSYVAGFYPLSNHRTLYISRGVGYGLRARFNCRPQITEFTLQKV